MREDRGMVHDSMDSAGGSGPPPEAAVDSGASDSRVAFVLELGRALHAYGVAAPLLEDLLGTAARRLGLEAQIFSTPTSIFAGFGTMARQKTYLLRVEPGGTDLGRLARTDEVIRKVLAGVMDADAGLRALERIRGEKPAYGPVLTVTAFALVSASAGRFLGGGVPEILVAGLLGAMTGLLSILMARNHVLERLFEAAGAFAVAFLAALLSARMGAFSVVTATLAGLIVLIPGMTLTTAMTELASRHLSSGTSRLSAAAITFLQIGLGVTLGDRVAALIAPSGAPGFPPAPIPSWTNLAALAAGGLAFTVLLRADRRDAPWIVLSGIVAFAGARLGGFLLGAELGVFVGALLVGLGSQAYARFVGRPSAVTEVPGVLILVPGSFGFRSLTEMMDREVVSGVETAFRMVMIAVALVSGLLIANLAAPGAGRSRRA